MAGHREGERSLVPNTKFKALVLIPSGVDSAGEGGGVYVRAKLRFGNNEPKLGRGRGNET